MGNQCNYFGGGGGPIIVGPEITVFSAIDADDSEIVDTGQYGDWQMQIELAAANPQACAQIIIETKIASSSTWAFVDELILTPGAAVTKAYNYNIQDILLDDTRITFKEVVDGCTLTILMVGTTI